MLFWVLGAVVLFGTAGAASNSTKASGSCGTARSLSSQSSQCELAKSEECDNAYAILYYCSGSGGAKSSLVILYCLWLVLLFVLLGSTADEYFSPALEQMSSDFGLPPRFAGVTLLALGNGAPDVSSTMHAVASSRNGYRLALGALTGAGMFVGTVVAGAVCVVADGAKAKGALLRDVSAYLCVLVVVLGVIGIGGKVTYGSVALFLGCYALFVVTVLAADLWHRRPGGPADKQRRIPSLQQEPNDDEDDEPPAVELLMTLIHSVRRHDYGEDRRDESRGGDDDNRDVFGPFGESSDEINFDSSGGYVVIDGGDTSSPFPELEMAANGGDAGGELSSSLLVEQSAPSADLWKELADRCYSHTTRILFDIPIQYRFLAVAELPFVMVRRCTVPLTSEESYARGPLIVSVVGAPLWLCFYASQRGASVAFAAYAGSVVAGIAAAAGVALATRKNATLKPIPSLALALFGFVVAATWIDVFADQLVSVLEFLGAAVGIPETVLGLTVLAWGNSVGDFSTNIAMAKRGLANMSMTACFAGPLFNALVGLGVGFSARLAQVKKDDGKSYVEATLNPGLWVGFVSLILNCLAVLAVGIFNRGHIPRQFGFVSIALYLTYLSLSFVVLFQ